LPAFSVASGLEKQTYRVLTASPVVFAVHPNNCSTGRQNARSVSVKHQGHFHACCRPRAMNGGPARDILERDSMQPSQHRRRDR
jgi:hypothetical protein